jgi:predicted transcriptional regulator of viral defense system
MKTRLGRLETQFLAYVQMRKRQAVRTGELTGPLRLSPNQERELFRRLARGQLIARVRPGLYLVPPQLPLGGAWSPDEALAINTLMADTNGRYQVCGPNAFNQYSYSEQIPNRIYAYNDRISGSRTIGSISLTLIKVDGKRLGNTQKVRTSAGSALVYASRVRTLVDAVYDWARFNSLPQAYQWIAQDLKAGRISARELVDTTLRYGDIGTIRRMGVLLERERVGQSLLNRLRKALPTSSSVIPWIPRLPKRGTVNRRWGVVENDKARGRDD